MILIPVLHRIGIFLLPLMMSIQPIFVLAAILIVSFYFIFRKKRVAQTVLAPADLQLLNENVTFYHELTPTQKKSFEEQVSFFLSTVKIEGVGLTVSALDRLLVASSAIIPIFGFDQWRYKNLTAVVLYPDTFNKDFQFAEGDRNIMGMVGDGYMNGQMILSQTALHHGFSKSAGKGNTGIHEFVHLLDEADGAIDGVPEHFLGHEYAHPWIKMMHQEIQKIEDNQSDINPYATTNEAEFFAVVSEYFFEQPAALKDKHPELYKLLSRIFDQDLAATKGK